MSLVFNLDQIDLSAISDAPEWQRVFNQASPTVQADMLMGRIRFTREADDSVDQSQCQRGSTESSAP